MTFDISCFFLQIFYYAIINILGCDAVLVEYTIKLRQLDNTVCFIGYKSRKKISVSPCG